MHRSRLRVVPRSDRWLTVLLLLALLLRLVYGLTRDLDAYYTSGGGDTRWYLENGYTLVTGDDPGNKHDVSRLPTAPLYLVMIGLYQAVLNRTAAIAAILITQALLSTSLIYFGYRLACRLTGDQRAARLAAGVLAFSPALILESAQIVTETLFMALLMAGLWAYMAWITMPPESSGAHHTPNVRSLSGLAAAGLLLGLATLTRAVLLLFPLGLGLYLVLRSARWQTGLRHAATLLVVYSLVVLSWTAYNLVRWQRVVIGAEGFASFIYLGSQGWQNPDQVDQTLAETITGDPEGDTTAVEDLKQPNVFLRAARRVIAADPAGYVKRRVSELASAYLQPHATVIIGGTSLKTLARDWITHQRSLDGLRPILNDRTFWPKLALYVFHFVGLIAGAVGMWRWRHSPVMPPLAGLVLYFTLLHLVMLALPRYLFPLYPVFWVFAAGALIAWWDRLKLARSEHRENTPSVP